MRKLRAHKEKALNKMSTQTRTSAWCPLIINSRIPIETRRERKMTPMTLQECQVGINNLRLQEPDADAVIEEAIDPNTQEIVARLYLQFRDPFHSFRQEG